MERKLRTAIIGAGWWSTEYHIPGVLSYPDAHLTAVCDPDEARLAAAARAYPLGNPYADYRDLLAKEDLDCAIIVTPHATHFEIAQAAQAANLHLLVEKPMTLFARDAGQLVQTARERGKTINLGYPHNFGRNILRGRAAVTGGELGDIHYLDGSFISDMTGFLGGNAVAENPVRRRVRVNGPSESYNRPDLMGGGHGHLQLTHLCGMLFFVTGLRARVVEARMHRQNRALDMVDAIAVEFDNGALGLVGGTGTSTSAHRLALSVFCERGCFVTDSLAGFSCLRRQDGTAETLPMQPAVETPFATTHNFLDTVLGRAPSYAPGDVGWRAVELLDAAYRSAQAGGKPVAVEDLYA